MMPNHRPEISIIADETKCQQYLPITEIIGIVSIYFQVYQFKNLVVRDYKGPQDKFNRLSSKSTSIITEVTGETAEKFSEINDGDGVIKGVYCLQYVLEKP